MKKIILIVMIASCLTLAALEDLTIFNNNLVLVKTGISLDLKKGTQSIFYDEIPSGIDPASVILKNDNSDISLLTQNYEYDIASAEKILRKYIGEEITVNTKDNKQLKGELQFAGYNNLGLIDSKTKKLYVLSDKQINYIEYPGVPDNFYLKPTLQWLIGSNREGKTDFDFSYLSSGMTWEVTYNCVYNEKNEKLSITPWVTINNRTGKAFDNARIKLMAGDVKKVYDGITVNGETHVRGGRSNTQTIKSVEEFLEFEEKSFADYHLYTLNQRVDVANNQVKQITMFPEKSVKAVKIYKYTTHAQKLNSVIRFENKKENGLGLPLPKGIVKIYQEDKGDNQMEFIGEDRIDHTSKKEKVELSTGSPFDILAKTEILNSDNTKHEINSDYKVVVKNRSGKTAKVLIDHHISIYGNWNIYKYNTDFEKINKNTIRFEIELAPDSEKEVTWKQTIKNRY